MSFSATAWAWRQEGLTGGAKLVLLALAEGASSETGECWHSQGYLARMTGFSRSTVNRHVQDLQEKHLVEVSERQRQDGSRTSNLYRLPLATTLYQSETPPVAKCDTPLSQNATAEPGSREPVSEPSVSSQIPLTTQPPFVSEKSASRARARESAEKEAEEWYGAYPRKVNPQGAKHLYAQLRLKGALLPQEEMLVRLERQKRSPGWQEQRFIPYPRTYLHQTRWEDPEALPPPPPPEEEVRCVMILGDDNRYHPEVWYQERRWNREQWENAGRTWPGEETR